MSDEDKAIVDETTSPASGDEQTPETTTEEAQVEESQNIDYKKELEIAESRLGKAEHTIVQEKGKRKEAEAKAEDTEPTFTLDDVRDVIRQENQVFQKETKKDVVENKLRESTRNDDEFKLALHHYQNSIVVSGNDKEDISNAVILANKKRYSSDLSESMASARSKDTVVTTSSGGGQKQQVERKETIILSDEERKIAKGFGISDEQLATGFDRGAQKAKMLKERADGIV